MNGFDKAVAMEMMTNEGDAYKKFMYGYIRLKEENARLREGIKAYLSNEILYHELKELVE